MNKNQLTKTLSELRLPIFFNKKDNLAYYTVSQNNYIILVGVYLNRSSDKDSFYIEYFIQPLFVPFHTLTFSLGGRIGDHWKNEQALEIEKKLAQLKPLKSFVDIANIIKEKYNGADKEYLHQSLSFISYIQGDIDNAKLEINKIITEENESIPPWREEEIKKSKEILELIDKKGKLDLELRDWQESTMKNLKLTKTEEIN